MDNNINTFCRLYGIEPPLDSERITSGRNSEVWRLFNDKGQWILKNYHQNPGDPRDRLGTEFRFLSFLMEHKVYCIPEPIGINSQRQCALYSFLPGDRPKKISELHIKRAAGFIKEINHYRREKGAKDLSLAADSCFSIQDHLDLVNKRITRLLKMQTVLEIEKKAGLFVQEHIIPAWENIKNRVIDGIPSIGIDMPLSKTSWILSPSDFGFHNTLEHDGELSFIDFEYAGWDDPVKLMCDFACQPEIPVSMEQTELFINELKKEFQEEVPIKRRIASLMPVHRLKWCCILLNEFLPVNLQRRLYAGKDGKSLLPEQLEKAKKYFNDHLKNY